MRELTKKKSTLASIEISDLKNKNEVAWDDFFLDFYFSIGGSVHAERLAMKKEEAELKLKQQEQEKAEKAMQEASVVFPEIPGPEAAQS